MATMVKQREDNQLPRKTDAQVKAENIFWEYVRIRDDKQEWSRTRDKMAQMYFNNQWDSEVKELLAEEDQNPVVLNTIRPRINQRVAMMCAKNPSGVLYGYLKDNQEAALRLNHLLGYVQYISKFKLVTEQALTASQREGVGYYIVYIDPDADFGRGEIKIRFESYRNVFVDKNVGEWDYANAPRIIHSRLYDLESFLVTFDGKIPDGPLDEYLMTSDEIHWSGSSDSEDEDNNKVIGVAEDTYRDVFIRVYDCYEKTIVEQRVLKYLTGTVVPLPDDYELTDNDKALIDEGTVAVEKMRVPRIKLYQCFGSARKMYMMGESTLPISEYPIVPVVCEFTGNTLHVGETDFVEGLQIFRNKAASMMMKNAALSSVPNVWGDSNAIPDPAMREEIEERMHKVSTIVWAPQKPDGRWPLEKQAPQPINQAFAFLVQFFGQSIDSTMSTWEFMAGNPEKVPNTATMGLSVSESAKDQLKLPLNHLEVAIERVFNLVLELVPHVYKERKQFMIMSRDGAPTGQNTTINDTVYDENMQMLTRQFDVTQFRAFYRIIPGSTLPPNSIAKLNLYKDLAQANPIFLKYLVEYLPDVDSVEKQEIIQQLDVLPQLQSQVQQLSEAIKSLQGELESSRNKEMTALKNEELIRYQLSLVKKEQRKESDTSEKGNK